MIDKSLVLFFFSANTIRAELPSQGFPQTPAALFISSSLSPFSMHLSLFASSTTSLSASYLYWFSVASIPFPSSRRPSRMRCQLFIIIFRINLARFIIFCVGVWLASQIRELQSSKSFLKICLPIWEPGHPMPAEQRVYLCVCVCVFLSCCHSFTLYVCLPHLRSACHSLV